MRWYAHMKRIEENRTVKKAFESEQTDVRKMSRPRERNSERVGGWAMVEQVKEILYDESA